MEYAQIEVRLAGSLENTVIKEVSVPEIPVLKSLHGHDAVVNIKKTRSDAVDQKEERDRLDKQYTVVVIEKLFPGVMNKLPQTLVEIGEEEPVVESNSKKK
jgi:hypothetical protein